MTIALRVAIRFEKTAASEIDPKDLPPDRLSLIKKLNLKPQIAFGGAHGYIVHLDNKFLPRERIPKDALQALAGDKNVRWVETYNDHIAIGF